MSADSYVQTAGSSNDLPTHGASVSRSCCWHQSASFPFCRICVLRMHSIPRSNARRHFARSSSGIGMSNGARPSYTSRIVFIAFTIAPSL